MNCPRTHTPMKQIEIGGVEIEVSEACGGIFFDNFELRKFDEVHESAGEELVQMMEKHKSDNVDLDQRIECPKCNGIVMQRRFYSPKGKIEIDECPNCGGIWLDPGELPYLRELFPTEEDLQKVGAEFVDHVVVSSGLSEMAKESAEMKEKAQRFANLFKWICPSSYIPGKQDWGAF